MKVESFASNVSSLNPSIAEATKSIPQAPPVTIKPKTKTKMIGVNPSSLAKKTRTHQQGAGNSKMGVR